MTKRFGWPYRKLQGFRHRAMGGRVISTQIRCPRCPYIAHTNYGYRMHVARMHPGWAVMQDSKLGLLTYYR